MEKKVLYFFMMITGTPLAAQQRQEGGRWINEFIAYGQQKAANQRLLAAAARPDFRALEDVKKAERDGADLNCTDANGNTPLILSTKAGNPVVQAHLLQNPTVDPAVANGRGETAASILAIPGLRQRLLLSNLYWRLGQPREMVAAMEMQPVGGLLQ